MQATPRMLGIDAGVEAEQRQATPGGAQDGNGRGRELAKIDDASAADEATRR